MRNHGIRSLRAFRALAHQLAPHRRDVVQEIIDCELRDRGALTHDEHVAKMHAEHRKREQKRIAATPSGHCPWCQKPDAQCDCIPF